MLHTIIRVMKMKEKPVKSGFGEVNFPVMPMEPDDMRLFTDDYCSGAASAMECTGLIQVSPVDDDIESAYNSIYSFRQARPFVSEEVRKKEL